jgi:hypothetical protein
MNVAHSMTRSGLLLLAVTGVVEAQQGNAASYEIAYTGMCEGSYRTCMANADGSGLARLVPLRLPACFNRAGGRPTAVNYSGSVLPAFAF